MPGTVKSYGLQKGLPKTVESICPECGKVIEAEYYDKDGKVYAKKTCPEHGEFDNLIWSDTKLYLKAEEYAVDGIGIDDPETGEKVQIMIGDREVPLHTSTILANVDLTNRCNMTCPICFAEANSSGYVYEPDYDTVVKMLEMLRSQKPTKCPAVQFSGGEPTIHPRFFDIVKKARELGFTQIQVASNGLSFRDIEFCKKAVEAHLHTIYLSFDGVTDDVYIQARARKMFHVKQQVLENLRSLPKHPSVVLVPTVVKGMKDKQLADLVKFAFENSDVVRGVNFQPVAFTGRITSEELEKGRFTIPDLVREFNEQSGWTTDDDWFGVPSVAGVSDFVSQVLGKSKVTFTVHPHCGIATYLYRGDDGKVTPITRFIDVKKFMSGIEELTKKVQKKRFKFMKKLTAIKALKIFENSIIEEGLPDGITKDDLMHLLKTLFTDESKATLAKFSWKMMFIGGMHFQDSYNYDLGRVSHCGIHYATPDMRVIPFCAYNSGPEYRKEIESKFSVPLEEYKATHKKEAQALEEALIVPEDQRPDL